ncbi:MBL fold metallo-hydrolase [Nitrosovibrio sp. Nv17]|uniref:MBL fold metallo-hydrolase n=1 Tax=Nitrosovibrio sp. Nv17 TaxID=1855339 RepID=UPI000908F002|nr:MBL fold metallo-hydrolase [Nitrosovibrio sp. Nv17]SFW35221.1 Phosphoribosyl 1,2-cyclic phosphodiesterase [Nitrosovibrio sp. Nv17]
MRFACLGSGSQGNGLIVEVGQTRVLLDCGFSLKETLYRLARLGVEPATIDAIIVTHEHDDHVGGVARLARRYDIPVWLTHGTLNAMGAAASLPIVNIIEGYAPFSIGDIEATPYPVPHDAREPAQFMFGDGARRLGILTDAGCSTPHIEAVLGGCAALVLECNHDAGMLAHGDYPRSLKARVGGRLGHLENSVAASLLASLDRSRLQHVIAAHLSRKNNTPRLAQTVLSGVLGCGLDWIGVADQDEGFGWRQIV